MEIWPRRHRGTEKVTRGPWDATTPAVVGAQSASNAGRTPGAESSSAKPCTRLRHTGLKFRARMREQKQPHSGGTWQRCCRACLPGVAVLRPYEDNSTAATGAANHALAPRARMKRSTRLCLRGKVAIEDGAEERDVRGRAAAARADDSGAQFLHRFHVRGGRRLHIVRHRDSDRHRNTRPCHRRIFRNGAKHYQLKCSLDETSWASRIKINRT